MFSSTGYLTQFDSEEEVADKFIFLFDIKYVDTSSVSEWIDVCNISLFDKWFDS